MKETSNIVANHGEADKSAKQSSVFSAPLVFREKEFWEHFKALSDEGNLETALTYLLDSAPKLSKSNVNRKEKMNHLMYMCRMVQRFGHSKYGYEKLLAKIRQVKNNTGDLDIRDGGIVELGCGVHDPISLSLYFYLNGHEHTHAVDMQGPRNTVYSAFSLYETLSNMALQPERYRYDEQTDMQEYNRRLGALDVEELEKGEFQKCVDTLDGKINYHVCDIADADIDNSSIALLLSFAVLEHVSDIDGTNEKIFNILRPGGYAYHFVDLVDHRSYGNRRGFDPFTFLTEADAPPSMNRLRRSEQLESLQRTGFEIVKVHSTKMEMSADIQRRLQPKWAAMSKDDQETIKLRLLVRKPA